MLRFPIYYQHDSMQCGIACLQMICKYYGKSYSLDKLSEICFATTEGVSFKSISDASKIIGFDSICGKICINILENNKLPVIIHWNQNHFVVLYKIKNKKYYVADPAIGLIKYSENDFAKHWANSENKGIVMFLKPNSSFYEKNVDKTTETRSFKFLFQYIKQYKNKFILVLLGLILGCIIQLILPFLTQAIVDKGINYKDVNFIWLVLIGQLVLTISKSSIDVFRRWILMHISMRVNISLVNEFFFKLLKLPMSYFDTKLLGDLTQRIQDHTRVEKFLTTQTLTVAFAILNFIVFSLVLFLYNKLIFIVFVIGSLIYALWIALFLKKRRFLDYELFEKQSNNHEKTFNFLTSIQEIKLQGCEKRRINEWSNSVSDLFNVNFKCLKLTQTEDIGSSLINEIKNIFITFLSASLVIDGNITLGMMLSIQYIIGQLNSPVEQIMNFVYALQDVKISLERINEIHSTKNEETENRHINELTINDDIIFKNVDFKYDPHSSRKILDNISITIPNGKVTAIVGTSGSGKTTLIKLMLGYYSVLNGSLCIGKNNIENYNLKFWRNQCGIVMQDGYIFSESIARNIAIDDGDINYERLYFASEVANIKDYILNLPLKYETKIGRDGVGLSQGQKQRILIARAVYKNPKFLFFDEATNSLDTKNEKDIVNNLSKFYKGKTTVIVAHRLSTVRDADQIIVIDKGKIVEIGNHNQLVENKSVYFNLIKNQLELAN